MKFRPIIGFEFKRYFEEAKNYNLDYVSDIIAAVIFISGIILISINDNCIKSTSIVRLLGYNFISSIILSVIYMVETEIRRDYLYNLISSDKKLFSVYLNRAIVVGLESIIVFFISLAVLKLKMNFSVINDLRISGLLSFLIVSIVYTVFVLKIFFDLTIIFERILTFVALFNMYLLFLSGFVYDYSSVGLIFRNVSGILNSNNFRGALKAIPGLVILFLISYLLSKAAKRKLYYRGIN